MTRLISPLITVPCQIAILLPKKTSPMIVEFGATKTNPGVLTLRSYKFMMVRARLKVSLYFLGASILCVQNKLANLRLSILINK